MEETVKIDCPHCEEVLEVSEENEDMFYCPVCDESFERIQETTELNKPGVL